MADRVNSLLADLKRLKVETGSLTCMGCGREHNCGVHGCAVLREAADVLQEYVDRSKRYADEIMALRERQRWIPVTEQLPGNFEYVLCWYEYFRYGGYNAMYATCGIGYQCDGTWIGEVSNGTNARVLAWMPLPEAPELER